MRKLIIKRRKAIAGCAGKVKIYIADPAGDTVIRCTRCRFLGKIKNNETATFEIGTESVRIFAIYDNFSKDFCNDSYILPAGEDDCYVSGQAHFNPFGGNPFYFDGVTDRAVIDNRKNNKRNAIILGVSIAVGSFVTALVTGLCHYFL